MGERLVGLSGFRQLTAAFASTAAYDRPPQQTAGWRLKGLPLCTAPRACCVARDDDRAKKGTLFADVRNTLFAGVLNFLAHAEASSARTWSTDQQGRLPWFET